MQKTTDNGDMGVKLYELGFLVLPTVAEDMVSGEAHMLCEAITKQGGIVKNAEGPLLRGLAYTMTKHTEGKNNSYTTAYFGSVVFEAVPDAVPGIKKEALGMANILRFLIIETDPAALLPRERKVVGKIEPEKYRPEKSTTSAAPVSEEELDKKIEELVAQ